MNDVIPPHDLQAEEAVLGALMVSAAAHEAVAELEPEHFYKDDHRRIFEAAAALILEGKPCDVITVYAEAKQRFNSATPSRDEISLLASSCPAPGNAVHYARLVRDAAAWRERLNASYEIREAVEHRDEERLANARRTLAEVHAQVSSPTGYWRVDAETGETYGPCDCREQEHLIHEMDRKLKGAMLENGQLRADREAAAENHPLREQIDLIHAVWKKAFKRRRSLHYDDVERIGSCLKRAGLRRCLEALAGAKYDAYENTVRSGRTIRYDDLATVFSSYGKMNYFRLRAPKDWEPKPLQIALISGVDIEDVERWLAAKKAKP